MQERRRTIRTRSYLGGQIAFNRRSSALDCLVRNVSANGARIVFSNSVTLPAEFDLHIRHQEQSFRARIVWRRESELGVAFLGGQPASNVVPLDLARRVRDLEADKAALQRRVAQLSTAE